MKKSSTVFSIFTALGVVLIILLGVIIVRLAASPKSSTPQLTRAQNEEPTPTIKTARIENSQFIKPWDQLTTKLADKGQCDSYGKNLLRTTDGKCWSLRSKLVTLQVPDFRSPDPKINLKNENVCYHEEMRLEDSYQCGQEKYCVGYTEYLPLVEFYTNYTDIRQEKKVCYSAGVNTSISPLGNDYGVGCGLEEVSDNMCTPNYSCDNQARYRVIDNNCYHLANRKCTEDDYNGYSGNLYSKNTCCSDKVDMSYCEQNNRY